MLEITRRTLLQGTALTAVAQMVPSKAAVRGEKVLVIDLDDLGREYLNQQAGNGGAPNLAGAMAAGRTYGAFWAAPNCSVFRARAMTGLDAYRPGNLVGRIVGGAYPNFAGPSGKWVCDGLPGQKVKIGKVHIVGGNQFPGVMHARGWDRFVGPRANVNNDGGAGYYSWWEGSADSQGSSIALQTRHNTSRTAELALTELAAGTELLHVSFNAIHEPLELPPNDEPAGMVYSGTTEAEIRAAMLFHLDYWVGQLLAVAVPAGYVVLIACDNGTDGDGKGTYFEAGTNTHLIALGARVIPGVSNRLVQATDLWATIRRLRGDMSGSVALDSVDFLDDMMAARAVCAPRQFLTVDWFPFVGVPPPPNKWSRMIRDARWKYVDQKIKPSGILAEPVQALFDLQSDPEEQVNLLDAPLSTEAQAALDLLTANLP